jgi:hypothetical protein
MIRNLLPTIHIAYFDGKYGKPNNASAGFLSVNGATRHDYYRVHPAFVFE